MSKYHYGVEVNAAYDPTVDDAEGRPTYHNRRGDLRVESAWDCIVAKVRLLSIWGRQIFADLFIGCRRTLRTRFPSSLSCGMERRSSELQPYIRSAHLPGRTTSQVHHRRR
jgi:hypothetical protein